MKRQFVIVTLLLGLLAVVGIVPAMAQNPVWITEYYNNPNLSGDPVVRRNEPYVAFNYGQGSPISGVGNDNFSIRFATDVFLNSGTYRFAALADDNVRVTFNFGYTPVIDTFASPAVGQTVTGDVVVENPGLYHIQVDYREVTDNAYVYVAYANLATNPNGPTFAQPVPAPGPIQVNPGPWTAQYYSNTALSGDPTAIVTESSPTHNWGSGSPIGSVPADNWSARWTSIQNIPAGNYTVAVSADDGVRVIINGVTVINQFGFATGQTYTSNIYLPGGNTQIIVEFVEFGGNAFLNYSLSLPAPAQPQPTPPVVSPTGVSAVVTGAFRLNVRNAPDAVNGLVITRINQNESYPALGRNANSTWIQVSVNGTVGWVSARYVTLTPSGASLPVVGQAQTPPTQQPAPGGPTLTATPFAVNVRNGPGTQFNRIGQMRPNETAVMIGRNASNTWWQVNYNGIVGWVTAQYTVIQSGFNANSLPVTG